MEGSGVGLGSQKNQLAWRSSEFKGTLKMQDHPLVSVLKNKISLWSAPNFSLPVWWTVVKLSSWDLKQNACWLRNSTITTNTLYTIWHRLSVVLHIPTCAVWLPHFPYAQTHYFSAKSLHETLPLHYRTQSSRLATAPSTSVSVPSATGMANWPRTMAKHVLTRYRDTDSIFRPKTSLLLAHKNFG